MPVVLLNELPQPGNAALAQLVGVQLVPDNQVPDHRPFGGNRDVPRVPGGRGSIANHTSFLANICQSRLNTLQKGTSSFPLIFGAGDEGMAGF